VSSSAAVAIGGRGEHGGDQAGIAGVEVVASQCHAVLAALGPGGGDCHLPQGFEVVWIYAVRGHIRPRCRSSSPPADLGTCRCIFSRDLLDNGVLDTLRELEIGLVAFSPLGRGFLTGAITTVEDLEPGDARRGLPRFAPEAIAANLRLAEEVARIAAVKDATPAQIALAWVQAQGGVAIPGTRHRLRLDENAAATELQLTGDDLDALDRVITEAGVTGARDTEAALAIMHASAACSIVSTHRLHRVERGRCRRNPPAAPASFIPRARSPPPDRSPPGRPPATLLAGAHERGDCGPIAVT
jgi:hypothetical protein